MEKRFGFGKNWRDFLISLDAERIAAARASLETMLNVKDLNGRTFIDVGSGSGLFSLSARSLGAHVISFDYDIDSVECTKGLREKYFPHDDKWTVQQGSILDENFISSLGSYDIVYSWGVLHHTGDMWEACKNVDRLVNNGGVLFLAIYNDQGWLSDIWKKIKKTYVTSNRFIQMLLLVGIGSASQIARFLKRLVVLQNPFTSADGLDRKRQRGMTLWYDHVDWVGGYPFEVAKPEQIFDYFHARGYNLKKLVTKRGGQGCCEYVFCKNAL